MNILYLLLIILYATLSPLSLFYSQKLIYKDKNKYGVHIHYLAKYLSTLLFLPILFIPNVNLALIPQRGWSVAFLVLTFVLIVLGVKRAIKRKVMFFYFGGVSAAFMEELLYRSVIFGLSLSIWSNQWIALIVSSFLFGTWHLKNYYWSGKRSIIIQFFYTALFYGPIFALMRIYTGDIYLGILFHFLTDATCALAPDWTRGWLVHGGKGGNYSDNVLPKV
ncbi:MAG TPA: CPBP family intramembrane glutamic endopeptidase [Patescibacteria group bacterium]|nr:CPBP family intramembrane glutamic endopeptidase [Patescibacteria group bacterium]